MDPRAWRRLWILPLAFLFGALPVPGAGQDIACAAPSPSAALVVDTGSSALRYCVQLDASSVSGLHLIELASSQHGLSYKFGYSGNAVCMLAGVGPTSDDCFEQNPDFWGYWRGDGSRGWTWSGTGGGSTTVGDGDVEGWAWGSGQDDSTHPKPPSTTYTSVCGSPDPEPSSSPDPTTRKRGSKKGSGGAPGSDVGTGAGNEDLAAGGPAVTPADRRKHRAVRNSSPNRAPVVDGSSAASPSSTSERSAPQKDVVATAPKDQESGGPPVAGLIGLALAASLGIATSIALRRRRNSETDG